MNPCGETTLCRSATVTPFPTPVSGVLFTDLDVLAIGAVVNDVSTDFDRYWASDSAYPVDRLLKPALPGELDALEEQAAKVERSPEAATYARTSVLACLRISDRSWFGLDPYTLGSS